MYHDDDRCVGNFHCRKNTVSDTLKRPALAAMYQDKLDTRVSSPWVRGVLGARLV